MKRLFSILLATTLLFSFAISTSASNEVGNTYEIGNITVIFDASSAFSPEKQELVANQIVSPESGIATAGLICTLFGHKNTTETVVTITHKATETDPRCFEELFAVTSCSRCDETSTVRTGFRYISCCPEE